MDDNCAIESLKTWTWNISEVIRSLGPCPHAPRRSQLCRVCMDIEINMGLISVHMKSDPEPFWVPGVKEEALHLLKLLEEMCSHWPRPSTDWSESEQDFTSLQSLADGKHQNFLRGTVHAYLKEPFVADGLRKTCKSLVEQLRTEDPNESEEVIQVPEPADFSFIHKQLFLVLGKYASCVSCTLDGELIGSNPWHPTRLFLMDLASEDDHIQFDVITSSTDGNSWRDLCIKVSTSTKRRVAFALDDDKTNPSLHQPTMEDPKPLKQFCELFPDDDGCRISLKLDDGVLIWSDAELLKHRTSQHYGFTLAQVLERYVLTVKEKIALAHAITLAFWQFYDSQLTNRAWISDRIWFMPEPDLLQDTSERLPLKAYITFHPDATECDFDASEYVAKGTLVNRCPRIQCLAVLLLEIGLGTPFRSQNSYHGIRKLNYDYSVALLYLEKLQSSTWNFGHKYIYDEAVDKCLKLGGLTGKETNKDFSDGHETRRRLFQEEILSRLELLNRSFRGGSNKASYLSAKNPSQGNNHTGKSAPSPPRQKSTLAYHPGRNSKPVAPPASQRDFEVAIICALTLEADTIRALFDHNWDNQGPNYDKACDDPNSYSTGSIGHHNVVLVQLPSMGKVDAAAAATNCCRSFPNIQLALVVGICGAVPFCPRTKEEIVLGDVIISEGLIHYDFGRRLPNGFERKNTVLESLPRPKYQVRSLLNQLKGNTAKKTLQENMAAYLGELQDTSELRAYHPGPYRDKLFEATYDHVDDKMACQDGGDGRLVIRNRHVKGITQPAIHFGLFASGDSVMKSGQQRDLIAAQEKVIGFEMEGAGVWDCFPRCIVIKGACDYADSHKTKVWQHYAAATAAACTKAFLSYWPSVKKSST